MNKEKALKYLLLRNIDACRHLADKEKCEQLARTLSVRQIDSRIFSLSWEWGGEVHFYEVPCDRFLFFASAHRAADQSPGIDEKTNNTHAREIVYHLLNIDPSKVIAPSRKRQLPFLSLVGMIVLITALFYFGESPRYGSIIFAACLLAEFLPLGRVWSSVLLMGLFPFIPWTAALTALTYGFFQSADPNNQLRNTRILLCTIAFAAGVIQGVKSSSFGTLIYLPLIIPAGLLVILRNTWAIHWRAFPMVLPFVCVGFMLDTLFIDAAVVGIYCLVELLVLYIITYVPVNRLLPELFSNSTNEGN